MGPLLLNKMALKFCFFLLTFALQTIVLCDAKTTAERLAKGFEKKKLVKKSSIFIYSVEIETILDRRKFANNGHSYSDHDVRLRKNCEHWHWNPT